MRNSLLTLFLAAAGFALTGASSVHAGPLDSPGATKAMICSACHGFGGNSVGDTVPTIAGMTPAYFKKAIKDYAEGKRPSPEMEPYSKYVMQAGPDEIATYFAEQKKRARSLKADPKAVKAGSSVSTQCVACHGPKGAGDAGRVIPALQGQPSGFLQAQMALFKDDKRKLEEPALEENKKKVMKSLSDNDIASLAAYFSSLK